MRRLHDSYASDVLLIAGRLFVIIFGSEAPKIFTNQLIKEIRMPVYSFICQECGEAFEKQLSFYDTNNSATCPNGHTHVTKKISLPAVVFKGSGFYVTDHRSKPHSKDDHADKR
jgi:putative FmdB family regulatory protein